MGQLGGASPAVPSEGPVSGPLVEEALLRQVGGPNTQILLGKKKRPQIFHPLLSGETCVAYLESPSGNVSGCLP